MGDTAPRLTAEPGSSPESETSVELRALATRSLRLVASRWRLLVLCACVGALAAFAAAEIHGRSSPSTYRATFVLRLHDNPLVYHVPPLALNRVKDAGGMPYQVQVAFSEGSLTPAAKTLGISPEALHEAVTIRAVGNRLIFATELRGRARARQTVAALAASYRAVREAVFVYTVNKARAQLLHTAETASTKTDRTNARTQAGYAAALLRDKASITRVGGSTLEPLDRSRSPAVSALLGAVAGVVVWLLVVIVLAVAAVTTGHGWTLPGWRRQSASRGGAA